jgi:dipeptidase
MCDTFVSIVPGKKVHSVIFGKNSDREPNEAQILEYHPAQSFSTKEKVHCTYISIPQVRETRGVLLCRPFWMWGAEMGANEKGVVIGNEAVFTKMPYKDSGGLTGMDILRLTLERSDSAAQALELMIGLLADYGQGGNCGFQNKKLVYHNSFIIADAKEAWVLETAGELWAALKVRQHYSISNGLTIGKEFDRSHPRLIETAKHKKLLKSGREFHFAECYSDWLYTTFSESARRQSCTLGMLPGLANSGDITDAFKILRTHNSEPYNPASHMLQNSICAHAANGVTRNAGTTGSMVAHLRQDEENLFWVTATAAPCTSVFKPVWLEGEVLPDLGPLPKGQFNTKSYWWYHERLHRALLADFSVLQRYVPDRDKLQSSFIKYAYRLNAKERFDFTCESFKQSRELTKKWWHEWKENQPKSHKSQSGLFYRRYWNNQNEKAELYL